MAKQRIELNLIILTDNEIEQPIREFLTFVNSMDEKYERVGIDINTGEEIDFLTKDMNN
jgi:hypothetical protein